MIISLLVYVVFNKHLPIKTKSIAKKSDKETGSQQIANMPGIVIGLVFIAITAAIFHFAFNQLSLGLALGLFFGFVAFIFKTSTKEEMPSVVALVLVFVVVIFFWMSFHQNGLTQTFFARDYTVKEVGPINNIFFNLNSILAFIGSIAGLVLLITKKKLAHRAIGLAMFAGLGALTYYIVSGYQAMNPISPEIFQSFNPLFIVALTFPVMGIFTWLRNRNIEPSTPRKIGIGMIIASSGFVIMLIASLNLVAPKLIASANMTEWGRVSPAWLISSYLILTIAELFLSPMGLSFVSKVSPLRFQGLMQGGWLLATATGNKLLFIGGYFWDKIELWQIWAIFVVCCLLSATFIFSIMKRLERTTTS
jgi:POT family proton-dependent oligopeptide transporter